MPDQITSDPDDMAAASDAVDARLADGELERRREEIKTAADQPDPVREQAITAAQAVLDAELPTGTYRDLVSRALDAAGEVYGAAQAADAERMVADTGLISMEALPEQGVRLRIALGLEMAAKMLGAFRALLDAHKDAINYVEQQFISRETGESYVAIIVRPGGHTPHQLRQHAETRLAATNARLARAHDALTRIDDGDTDDFTTLESTVDYVVNRYRAVAASEEQAADEIERLRTELRWIADFAREASTTVNPADALPAIRARADAAAGRVGPPTVEAERV